MNIQEAIRNRVPLRIHVTDITTRIMAELFVQPRFIAFADAGWQTNDTGHTLHILQGDVVEVNPLEWNVVENDEVVATITPIDHGDPDASAWNDWITNAKGDPATQRAKVAEMIERDFLVNLTP